MFVPPFDTHNFTRSLAEEMAALAFLVIRPFEMITGLCILFEDNNEPHDDEQQPSGREVNGQQRWTVFLSASVCNG